MKSSHELLSYLEATLIKGTTDLCAFMPSQQAENQGGSGVAQNARLDGGETVGPRALLCMNQYG